MLILGGKTLRAVSPDGREWEIRVRRVQLPRWPESDYDPDPGDLLETVFAYVIAAPLFWLVIPLLKVIVALPVCLARSLFSSSRWVEATTRWPSEIVIVWRTTSRHAAQVAREVAERLPRGYEHVTPEGAELVSMTRPPGSGDRFA